MYKRYQKSDYQEQYSTSSSLRGRGRSRGRGGRGRGSGSRGRGSGGYSYTHEQQQQQQTQYVPKQSSEQQQYDQQKEYGQEVYYDPYGNEYYPEQYYDEEIPQQEQQFQQKESQYKPKAQMQQESYRQVSYKPQEFEEQKYSQASMSTQSREFVPKTQYQPKEQSIEHKYQTKSYEQSYQYDDYPKESKYQHKQQTYEDSYTQPKQYYEQKGQSSGYQQQQEQSDWAQQERQYAELYGEEYGREVNRHDDYLEEDYFDETTTQDSRQTKSSNQNPKYEQGYDEFVQEPEEFSEDQAQSNEISNHNYCQGPRTEQVGSPCNVMMVAEKPSIALSITEALSQNYQKKAGAGKSIPLYTFKGNFQGMPANFKVTSVAGHVFNRDFPIDYSDRRKDPIVLFEAPTIRKIDRQSRPILKHLQAVSRNVDFIVLWLDCDKEGENICYEVLDICRKNIPKSKFQRVFRAKFSSIAKKDIEAAFNALKFEPNYNESVSVDARQIMDLKIGVSFSRFQTQFFSSLLKNQSVRMVTYGPCQTPTLGFCVDQAERIKKFIPEPFWKIEPQIGDINSIKSFNLKWMRGKIFDRNIVRIIHARINTIQKAEVIDIKKSKVTQVRPIGLNTVKMLKVASKSFGMSSHDTMKIAEHLYLRGYITYPRTESTTFSSNFNFQEILAQHQGHPDWGQYVSQLLKVGYNKPKKGVDQGDHPPITPVKSATKGILHDRDWKLYAFITRSFLGCISYDAVYDSVEAKFSVGSEEFKLKGQILLEPGFLEIMPWHLQGDKEIPIYKLGQQVDIKSIRIIEGKTQVPGYLTEAKLISLMEKNGIGTDASIPTHINNIIERQYVQVREPGRQLVPSPLGLALVKGYCSIDPELVLPTIRKNIEKSCEMIAKGKADFSKVLSHVLLMFKKKFEFFKLSIGTMEKLLYIMLAQSGHQTKEIFLKSKIPFNEEDQKTTINFCIRCFKGYFTLQYHNKKGYGIKCDNCKFRVAICEGASKVTRENEKCDECDSYKITVFYKEKSPFPGNQHEHTGCILCDSQLNQLIVNFFSKKQKKDESEMTEEEKRAKEDRIKKQKEEKQAKKLQKQEEEKIAKGDTKSITEGVKKKKQKNKGGAKIGPNDMTDQERINQFMKKFA